MVSVFPSVVRARWSLDEYHRMIEAGILRDRRVELLSGEIVEMAPEGEMHAHLSSDGADYLRGVLGDLVKIREAKPITLPNQSEPEPDIAIVQPLGDEYIQHHPFPDNIFWVMEYSQSSLAKDLELKTAVYAKAGIEEYWVIDLVRMELVVFRNPEDGGYRNKQVFLEGTIHPLAFPERDITVARLLRR